MLYRLRRHPLPMAAHFRHSLVLTYALPAGLLEPLLPPGLRPDTYRDDGFVAVAVVDTRALRPAFLPERLGRDYLLTGYRIFVRRGAAMRGLYILRSDTSDRLMAAAGNLLTRYRYHTSVAALTERPGTVEVEIETAGGEADLSLVADLDGPPAPLPGSSPFSDLRGARRYAGPLPYTFDYEPETGSLVAVKGVRKGWDPRPVAVEVRRCSFLERAPFAAGKPRLAQAFYVGAVDYRWGRGRLLAATDAGDA